MKELMFVIVTFICFCVPLSAKEIGVIPTISVVTLEGKKIELGPDKIMKPTLIVFWATWCEMCVEEIPALKKLYLTHKDDVDVIGISLDENREKLKKMIQEKKIEYPNIMDDHGTLSEVFEVDATPSLFAVDTKGKIVKWSRHLSEVTEVLLDLVPKKPVQPPSITRDAVIMGTNFSVVILSDDEKKANDAIDAALAEIKRIEDLMTDWRESELMRVNHQAGKAAVKLSPELIALLDTSLKASQTTSGVFDITYAPLGAVWDYTKEKPVPPNADQIKKARALVNYRDLFVDTVQMTAHLKRKNMRVGLGGIAKGYAIGRAAQTIKERGFVNFVVKAGGDMFVHGKNNGDLWKVAIQDPRDKSKNFAMIPLKNGAVSTSGDYERFFIYKGKRYAHIIDPRTGYPADKCQSVTVITKDSVWADVLSKTAFILGPEAGMKFIEKQKDVEAVIVDAQGEVHVSSGLKTKKVDIKTLIGSSSQLQK